MQKGSYKNGKPTGLWIFYEKNGIKERNRKFY
jgi:antitoxin component YwqK of YwqJK toxin-antitoxin module